ncbi:hypothetical protein SAMN04489806_2710 [Paramicrobacterium humi]|uniref:Uncharacterized protein n=1 Tax=Paramicrobacterium humi TaxID=640635 RepID=A0A1H4Q4M2_9MICO|nr:hypothetical protein [Microbacterium humi]SEC14539.1 hypothetical protein SAMN04489806_2710 [Microbacterium humi]
MNLSFSLSDNQAVSDLNVYVSRAKHVDPDAIRLIATRGVLAVYAPVLYARGLLDASPTVLGLRTFAETSGADFDRTVTPAAISDRIAALAPVDEPRLQVPPNDVQVAWAGIAPPRGGWARATDVESDVLSDAARSGAAEIAAALPASPGDPVVQRIRSDVWARPLEHPEDIPSGAAFAAESLGFLHGPERLAVFRSGPWLRLTSRRGHVLVKQR